jgi:hypothetical protein
MSSRASILLLALVVAGVPACSNSNSTGASQTATFTAALSPTNEVPAATGSETSGSGNATITLTFQMDSSNNVTSATATFNVSLTGFPSTTVFTMAHIHQAAAGVAGAIVVNTGLASGQVTLTNGAGSFTETSVSVPADIAQSMLSSPSGFYFNVHTVANASGVARGQLVRTQ